MLIEPQLTENLSEKYFSSKGHCFPCREKQIKIDKLTEQVESLRARLTTLEKKAAWIENPHVPSSKEVFPAAQSSLETKKKPGLKKGHEAYCRKPVDYNEPHRFEKISMPECCPDCGDKLYIKAYEERKLTDVIERKVENIILEIAKGHCKSCHKNYSTPISCLPKSLLGNQLLAESAVLAYFDHIPLGKIIKIFGSSINNGTLCHSLYRAAELLRPAFENLKLDYRNSLYRHADETGWRTDGASCYAWFFCTPETTVFNFSDTRSANVVRNILGTDNLSGFLTVDRYNGYNQVRCNLQYCFAHLLREAIALEKEFPLSKPAIKFSKDLSHLLSESMKLQKNDLLDDLKYYESAKDLSEQIKTLILKRSRHLGILRIQGIFRDNAYRLYHWVDDRQVSNHNNFAERSIRGTVIARKTSYGSKSAKGRDARSILMSILYTANQRFGSDRDKLVRWFKETLDLLAVSKDAGPEIYLPRLKNI